MHLVKTVGWVGTTSGIKAMQNLLSNHSIQRKGKAKILGGYVNKKSNSEWIRKAPFNQKKKKKRRYSPQECQRFVWREGCWQCAMYTWWRCPRARHHAAQTLWCSWAAASCGYLLRFSAGGSRTWSGGRGIPEGLGFLHKNRMLVGKHDAHS